MRKKRFSALALSALLLLSLTGPAAKAASQSGNSITISSVEDLVDFAASCSLDSWSRGKTVTLTRSLNLTGSDFTSIPTFGGTFDGGGYTISGYRLTVSGSHQGLFRYIQSGGTVKNLTVQGTLAPQGSRTIIGGICGDNSGAIQNCSFSGTVEGDTSVGGIAGVNRESGQILSCRADGSILADDCAGGVAGRNLGTLLSCSSHCSVNTTSADSSVSLEDLDVGSALDSLTDLSASSGKDAESDSITGSRTDTGGIVGYSSGIVQSCTNTGSVGYPHVGYNVGGIAGRQSGYLAGCVNTGSVQGRKDVGGIVGQAEPYLIVSGDSDTVSRMRTELDKLNALVNQALTDADGASDTVSARLTSIGACADSARDSSKILLDKTETFIDGNVDSLNTLSADLTNALDKMKPAVDDLGDAADNLATLSDQLEEALKILADASDTSETVLKELKDATDNFSHAAQLMSKASDEISAAMVELKDAIVINNPEDVAAARTKLINSLAALETASQSLSDAIKALNTALNGDWNNLATADAQAALLALLNSIGPVVDALADISGALGTILASTSVNWTEVQSALSTMSDAMDKLSTAFHDASDALSDLSRALGNARTLSGQLGDAAAQLEKVAASAASVSRSMSSAFKKMGDAIDVLTKSGGVSFTTLGDDYRAAGDDLYASLASLSDEMSALNGAVSSSGKVLSADIRAISNQFNVVFDLLLDMMDELEHPNVSSDLSDYLEDTSDENIAATRQGKISDSRNTGGVSGDRNVGGIVGAMAVEYDTDPEDDVSISYKSTYETKAVVQSCLNRGTVTGKKDCVGGIAGRMDLGTVLHSENYGDVESTNGDDVGGIAGLSSATVRESWSKCTISGGDKVGGIVGSGKTIVNCCAIVTVGGGSEYVGAIAGDADSASGHVRGNVFVDTGTAGVDGISYTGCAEPAAFDALRARSDLPAELISFTLTLRADDKVVDVLFFQYGEDLALLKLPDVPEKDGYYGVWPEFDVSGKLSDLTLDAVYEKWITVVASDQTSGKLSLALCDGQFTDSAALTVVKSAIAPPETLASNVEDTSVYEIALSGTDVKETDTVPLRLLCRGDLGAVWQYKDGAWQEVNATQSGHYLLLDMSGTGGTFCVRSTNAGHLRQLLIPIFVGLGVVLIALLVLQKRRKKKAAAAGKAAQPK